MDLFINTVKTEIWAQPSSELEYIRETKAEISTGFLVIGGVKQFRVKEVMDAGADGIALVIRIFGGKKHSGQEEEF